ncbi:MAG: hypothetical protein Q9203_006276 [Teloschistes exilis]
MLADVKLPFQPTATNCLAWSADGELAIGAGEFVHLLIPRRNYVRSRLHAFDLDPWVHIAFRINSFTVDEWPTQPLSDLDNFSIGEEQSLGTVVALSWSTLTLAKHRRFVLAILTSNHVLSLWASASDPKLAASWERVLVINKAIELFAEANIFPNASDKPSRDRLRQMMRIRAMSWAPEASTNISNIEEAPSNLDAELVGQVQHLAMTDDAGNVAVVQIESPWSDRRSPNWEARTIFHVNWDRLQKPLGHHVKDGFAMEEKLAPTHTAEQPFWPSLFATCLSKKNFIQSVMCVPCRNHEQGFGLVLHKDWQVLHLDIPYYVSSQASTIEEWILLSSGVVPSRNLPNSPSYVAFANAGNINFLSWKDSHTQIRSFTQEWPLVDEWDEISETHDKVNSRTGSAADVNRESLDEYIVVDTVPEAMDVDETGDGNMMGEELDTLEDSAFANTLFAMFDVCPYCQSKYVG